MDTSIKTEKPNLMQKGSFITLGKALIEYLTITKYE